ncbi:hypothetical protein X943_000091 [Babesia divergens]|uniref:Uncharacterized protein n=1 Tax=Babesia divergens TaxID=32595 RepID=A0AAD9G6B7_BABDI|nr:hypothetical protein X943_000091 [Babesia divergens]
MALKPSSLDEKIKEVRQAALRYCGTADTNLKHALIQAEERLNHAKREFLRLEEETSKLTSKYSLKRLSRIMEITNSIVDQKPMGTQDLKPSDIDAIRRYYIPYVQQKKVIEMRSKEFELIQRRIALNAEIYMQYKEELDNVTTE